jgi:shikimate dehydrogenase
MKSMKQLLLIGMPGCGKTTLGRQAAKRLNLPFADTDEMIERETAMSIKELFQAKGEACFRDMETNALRWLKMTAEQEGPRLISVGGGMVERAENRALMRELGPVVFIDRPLELIGSQISYGTDRPLLTEEKQLKVLYERRRPLYEEAADFILRNQGYYPEALERFVALATVGLGLFRYGVIGDPIGHSLSPSLHGLLYETLGLEDAYGAIRIEKADLGDCMAALRRGTMDGVNVTIPHKIAVIEHLDGIRGDAIAARAVNTVKKEGARLIGYNTDMEGLHLSLLRAGRSYENSKVVILGGGGAAVGILRRALKSGARQVIVATRNPKQAAALIETAQGENGNKFERGRAVAAAFPDGLAKTVRDADILINATPLGMAGTESDFSDLCFLSKLPATALVYDLVYNPAETRLLKQAKALGLEGENGLGMLIFQGILSDEIFLGRRLDREVLYEAIYDRLKENGRKT